MDKYYNDINKRIKLPMDLNPQMKTYHIMAHPLGIIGGCEPNKERWIPWLYNKYINCYYTETPVVKFDVHEADKLFFEDNVFEFLDFAVYVSAWNDMLGVNKSNFLEWIKGFLKKGYYVWGTYNERYIKSKHSYQLNDFQHDYLIYGYDNEKEIFYSAGYTVRNIYEEFEISFEEYYASIFQTHYNKLLLRVLKFNPEANFKMNICGIIRDMEFYLESKVHKPSAPINSTYGIDATYKVIQYLETLTWLDIRFVRVLLEQKTLMLERLNYFNRFGIMSNQIYQDYKVVQSDMKKAYLLCLKYNIVKQDAIKDRCINYIKSAIEYEKMLLIEAIGDIKKYIDQNNVLQ